MRTLEHRQRFFEASLLTERVGEIAERRARVAVRDAEDPLADLERSAEATLGVDEALAVEIDQRPFCGNSQRHVVLWPERCVRDRHRFAQRLLGFVVALVVAQGCGKLPRCFERARVALAMHGALQCEPFARQGQRAIVERDVCLRLGPQ